jgi:hypothetical protein
MALIVITETQEALLKKIECAIDAEVVEEWWHEGDRDFVFSGERGTGVRFRPIIDGDAVVFGIIPLPGVPLTPATYARVHASFAELLLGYADDCFDSAEITARFCEYDHVG